MKHKPITQMSPAPIFKVNSPVQNFLSCASCNQSILIENYSPQNFIAVSMKCHRCGEVTTTPTLEPGEIVPEQVIIYKQSETKDAHGTLPISSETAITHDGELVRIASLSQPRNTKASFFPSIPTLNKLEAIYSAISAKDMAHHHKKAAKFQNLNNELGALQKYPFAWACAHIRDVLKGREHQHLISTSNPKTLTALSILECFTHFMGEWSHHPRFLEITKEFRNNIAFHHTIAVFVTASTLFRLGFRVAIVPAPGEIRTADMYMRLGVTQKFHIEVKTPRELNWGYEGSLDVNSLKKVIKDSIEDAKGQISYDKPGVLAIVASRISLKLGPMFNSAISQSIEEQDSLNSGLAGIMSVYPYQNKTAVLENPRQVFGFKHIMLPNSKYTGANPFFKSSSDKFSSE